MRPRTVLAQCRSAFVGVGMFSCVVNILMLTGPLFMLQVYDRVLASGSVPTLVALTVLMISLYVMLGVMEFIRSRILVRIGTKLDEALRGPIFNATMIRGAGSIGAGSIGAGSIGAGSIGGKPLRDLDTVRQFGSGPGPFAFFDMPWAPIYIGIIFIFHSVLGAFALFAAAALIILALLNEILTAKPLANAAQVSENAHAFAEESRRSAEAAQAMGMGHALQQQWLTVKRGAMRTQMTASDRSGLLSSVSKTSRLLFQSSILGLGAWLAIRGEITPGTMIAASILMGRALSPIDQALAHWRGFQSAREAWQRLSKLLSVSDDVHTRTPLPDPTGVLSVEGLSAWAMGPNNRPLDKPIVSGVTFALRPGDGLGIIGPSGAGKTSLVKAMLGLWPMTKGTVRLDGATLDQWRPGALGRHIGYLPQDSALFPGTIAQNIARYDSDPETGAIVEAATIAGAHDMILGLSNGYETLLGPDGQGLSGGQRQRIALARALYRNPCLIVMDEPNANLDAEGDAALTRAIASVRARGGVVIIIAHRPSAISAVDLVLMLRDGRQVAFGRKDEVLRTVTQQVPAKAVEQASVKHLQATSAETKT